MKEGDIGYEFYKAEEEENRNLNVIERKKREILKATPKRSLFKAFEMDRLLSGFLDSWIKLSVDLVDCLEQDKKDGFYNHIVPDRLLKISENDKLVLKYLTCNQDILLATMEYLDPKLRK